MIEPYLTIWQDECIKKLTPSEVIIIAETLLLSYQIVQASLTMSKARLTIQSELLNVVTLSINDTFDSGIQIENNDFTIMKDAITQLEQGQEQIKFASRQLKNNLPLLININPKVIQTIIINFKSVMLDWIKTQGDTIDNFEQIQQELMTTAHLFAHIHTTFQHIAKSESVEHAQLLNGANNLTNMYKKVENTMALLTSIRHDGIMKLEEFLILFFKLHYQVLYNNLIYRNDENIDETTFFHQKLKSPSEIFTLV